MGRTFHRLKIGSKFAGSFILGQYFGFKFRFDFGKKFLKKLILAVFYRDFL